MPADQRWIYDPLRSSYHNCPAQHQFEVSLVSWRLKFSEAELTYDDTENVMILDGHPLSCYFADSFCKLTTKTLDTLVWFSDDFCLFFVLLDFIRRMTKSEDGYWIETHSIVQSSLPKESDTTSGFKGTSYPYVHIPQTQNHKILIFHVLKYAQTFCGKPNILYSIRYSDRFVTRKALLCTSDYQTINPYLKIIFLVK